MFALAVSAFGATGRSSQRSDDDFPGFQSFQKMLARELGLDILAAMGLARAGASE
jgi:hypothetical protein